MKKKMDIISEYMAEIGSKGGKKSRRKLTRKQAQAMSKKAKRRLSPEQAKAMVRAREAKKKKD